MTLNLPTVKKFISLILLFFITNIFSQIEVINNGETGSLNEYIAVVNEFHPKNHPNNRSKKQIVWKSNDNLFSYGNTLGYNGEGSSRFWVYNMTIKQWKCIVAEEVPTNYGQKGVFNSTNNPGARSKSIPFTDSSGNLFLFNGGSFNDLWKYDIVLEQWAWIGGYNNSSGDLGNMGTNGVESATNFPSPRGDAKPVIGTDGNVYFYGGDSGHTYGEDRSDLWRYNMASNMWTRLSNNPTAELNNFQSGQVIGTVGVESPTNHIGRHKDYTSWYFNNALWYFGAAKRPNYSATENQNQVWKFNLLTLQWTCVKNLATAELNYGQQGLVAPENNPPLMYGVSNTVLINDEAYFVGGFSNYTPYSVYGVHNSMWKYNMNTNQFTWLKGNKKIDHPGFYGKKNVERTENMPAGRVDAFLWKENGMITLFGGKTETGNTIEFWNYNPTNNNYVWKDGKSLTYYDEHSQSFIEDALVASVYNKIRSSTLQWGNKGSKLWKLVKSGMWEYDITTSTSYRLIVNPEENGHYGQKGVAAPENIPPLRDHAVLWETDQKLFLLSGTVTGSSFIAYYNDFWSFDKTTKMWTWIEGAMKTETPYFFDSPIGVENSANFPKCRTKAQSWVDADQNLWLFAGKGPGDLFNDLWKYNTNTNMWILIGGNVAATGFYPQYFTDDFPPFLSQASCWSKGNDLYFYGGKGLSKSQNSLYTVFGKLSDVWKYSISSNTWTKLNGNRKDNNYANYGAKLYPATSNLPGTREKQKFWSDQYGNFWMYGGIGVGETESVGMPLFDLWKYDLTLNMWIWMDGIKNPLLHYDDELSAYDWKYPAVLSSSSPSFKANGKFYFDTDNRQYELNIENYPGDYNKIQGYARFTNAGDCQANSTPISNFSLSINNMDAQFYTNMSGYYEIFSPILSNTLVAHGLPQNNSAFNTTSFNSAINFTGFNNTHTQDFCISANETLNDLEITILPLTEARPGNIARYKVIYKNKGTTTISDSIEFSYDQSIQQFLSSTTTPTTVESGQLTYNFSNLGPFQYGDFEVSLSTNTPMDTPAVNGGDILEISAVINPIPSDNISDDNIFLLQQGVVNSFDPNDKTCLQGESISEDMIGKYLTYMIRFENTGNASAQNITVSDLIDITKFDIATIEVVDSSHSYRMLVSDENKVDFIFENIDLPFQDETNDGYIAFRLKSLSTLVAGNVLSNTADIFFDYNFAITTNTFSTTISGNLATTANNFKRLIVYPNPLKETLYFDGDTQVSKIVVYDISGRILSSRTVTGNQIDLSNLSKGIYVIDVFSAEGSKKFKIIRE